MSKDKEEKYSFEDTENWKGSKEGLGIKEISLK